MTVPWSSWPTTLLSCVPGPAVVDVDLHVDVDVDVDLHVDVDVDVDVNVNVDVDESSTRPVGEGCPAERPSAGTAGSR